MDDCMVVFDDLSGLDMPIEKVCIRINDEIGNKKKKYGQNYAK